MYPIALDHDRELAAEVGLLLSCYAIIDLFILHIFATVSGMSKDAADVVLGHIKGNGSRIELIREVIVASDRPHKDHELGLVRSVERATQIRNEYAHGIYSQVLASPTQWRMSLWLSDGRKRKKQFKDISVAIVQADGEFVRSVLESLFHFGGIEVAYE